MDDIHFAPPKKPWNDDSLVNTNEQSFQPWFQSGAKWISPIQYLAYVDAKHAELLIAHGFQQKERCVASMGALCFLGLIPKGYLPQTNRKEGAAIRQTVTKKDGRLVQVRS